MRNLRFALCCLVVAGCSRSVVGILPSAAGSDGAMHRSERSFSRQPSRNTQALKFLYEFKGGADGGLPGAGLIDVNGTLYGTTQYEGALGYGIVFSITPGTKKVLHGFGGPPDGASPGQDLMEFNGTIYGATDSGGDAQCDSPYGCGTVFSITPSGTERVLYAFKGPPDGISPVGPPVELNRAFYGLTSSGGFTGANCGSTGCGTVYKLTPRGESVVYRFKGGSDGVRPLDGLTDVNGTLYGVTIEGGAPGVCTGYNCGTFFKITPSGKETILHSFGGRSDGGTPLGRPIAVNGTLYGTTVNGGTGTGCGSNGGCGTVYKITPSGNESVIYSFKGPPDGAFPWAKLIAVNGALYGTTAYGGDPSCYRGTGCGTVFKVTLSGTESVLHSFTSGSDGGFPPDGLVAVDGTLYGTASGGGIYACTGSGCGTVFGISL